jgi:hypothetical protein
MALVSVGNFCQSVKNNSILLSPGIELTEGKQNVFITQNLLSADEIVIFDSFLTLLGLKFGEHLDNYGLSIFDENLQHIWFTSPTIGIGEGGVLGLMIGASDITHKAAFLPLIFEGKPDDDGVITGDYHIIKPNNTKVKCTLISIPNPMDSTKTNHYIGIKSKTDQFQIPFKSSSYDLSSAYINECWDEGHFEDCCRSLGFQATGSLSKMFKPCFTEGYFPSEGVLMLLTDGQIQPSDQYKASSRWTIKWVSHPDLMVHDKTKDNPVLMPLGEMGSVFAPNSCKATNVVITNTGRGVKSTFYMIHIKGVNNNGNTGHIPDHAGCEHPGFIKHVLKSQEVLAMFPEVVENAMKLSLGQLQQHMSGIKQMVNASGVDEVEETAF